MRAARSRTRCAPDSRAAGSKESRPEARRPRRSRTSSQWPSPVDRAMSEMVFDAIVAGLGAHGSAAAYHLAKRGLRVLGLERFARGHTLGSSGGLSRIIRLSYYEHPDYVPMLRRAWDLWRELERDSGETLLTQTGGLYLGPPEGELVAGAVTSARTHGLAHEVLDAAALRERFPTFVVDGDWIALFEGQAGW